MPDDTHQEKPPFKCGKCESRSLYRDDDRINNASFIVCRICGNRWPGGPAPVRVETGSKPEGEKNMPSKKGTCANCCRPDMAIISKGLCGTCNSVRVGRTGEALEKALADTKERLWSAYQKSLKGKEKPQPVWEPMPKTEENIPETIPQLSDEKTDTSDLSPKNEGQKTEENVQENISRAVHQLTEMLVHTDEFTSFPPSVLRDVIPIKFYPDDRDLFEYISGQAKKYRRTPDQQILYMIDCNRQADLEARTSTDRT